MSSFFKVIILIFMLNCAFNQESNKKIKAAIFDLDGTLLDTQRLYDEANQIVINQYGNGKKYDADLQVKIHGALPSFGSKYLIDYFEIKLTMDEFMGKKDEYLREKIPQCKPMEGVKELTHLLKHKYGLKLAIATSGFKNSTDIKLTNHKDWIKEDFDAIVLGDDERIKNGKPAPDIYSYACKELGLPPDRTFAVEDSPNGVTSAYRAGCKVIMIPDLTQPDSELEKLLYKKLDSLIQIKELLS